MINRIIIDTVWYGSASDCIAQAGAVLIFNGFHFKAYIGVGTLGDPESDAEQIADWGNIISKEVALAIFGNQKFSYDGLIYLVKEDYKC